MAVLVPHDLLRSGAVRSRLAERDHLVSRVAPERAGTADVLHLVERRNVRREAGELGTVREPDEELGPPLGCGLERQRIRDEDLHDLARRRRDRTAAPGNRGAREPHRAKPISRRCVGRAGSECDPGAGRAVRPLRCRGGERNQEHGAREDDAEKPAGRERHPGVIAAAT